VCRVFARFVGDNWHVPSIEKRTAWEKATSPALLVLGIGFVIAYSLQVLWLEMPDGIDLAVWILIGVTWVAFAVDYLVRLFLTPRTQRSHFFWHNLVELLSVFIPLFRALRVVDLFRGIPYFAKATGNAVRARLIVFASIYAVLFTYFISLGVLSVERDAKGANITSFGDAVWWACVTITSVGYGDEYPVTAPGRFLGVLLMFGGLAIIGAATAVIVSYLNERIAPLRVRAKDTEQEDKQRSLPLP
jgi:voltage-gated potassium channel